MSENDGGPAYPQMDTSGCDLRTGMSLRDWFAGQALAGWGETHHGMNVPGYTARKPPNMGNPERIALICYGIADAMLEARTT